MQNHERMKQKNVFVKPDDQSGASSSFGMARKGRMIIQHYSEALTYLRDYCLRHGRPMHFSQGDIFEAEGESGGTDIEHRKHLGWCPQ